MVHSLDVVNEDKDAAREYEQHRDDAQSTDGVEPKEKVYSIFSVPDVAKTWNNLHARGGTIVVWSMASSGNTE